MELLVGMQCLAMEMNEQFSMGRSGAHRPPYHIVSVTLSTHS